MKEKSWHYDDIESTRIGYFTSKYCEIVKILNIDYKTDFNDDTTTNDDYNNFHI